MATAGKSFEEWLAEKLTSLNPDVDTEVFVMYINGILDTDSSTEETRESILDLLGEFLENGKENVCDEILQRWNMENGNSSNSATDTSVLATQLSEILEKQTIETAVKPKEKSAEEIARKKAILAQYDNVVSDEEEDDDDDPGGDTDGDSLLTKNTNTEAVAQAVKEKREQSKLEHEKKKEKDKQDRELQKQKEKDRKDNEKKRTQKGERRR